MRSTPPPCTWLTKRERYKIFKVESYMPRNKNQKKMADTNHASVLLCGIWLERVQWHARATHWVVGGVRAAEEGPSVPRRGVRHREPEDQTPGWGKANRSHLAWGKGCSGGFFTDEMSQKESGPPRALGCLESWRPSNHVFHPRCSDRKSGPCCLLCLLQVHTSV